MMLPITRSQASGPSQESDAPESPITTLPSVGPAVDPDLIRDERLHELFEAQADARPSAIAVECGAARTTYAELDRWADQIAHYLRSRGVVRGDAVAMRLPRSADVYAALLGIMKAGAAYVPVDPEFPPERAEYIIQNSKARALITTSALACGAKDAATVLLDVQRGEISRLPAKRLTREETGSACSDLCYIIYTSGSTGHPKGVMIEHRSACHLVRAEQRIYGMRPEDRVYQGFSIAFDGSVEEVWMALSTGATLVAATAEVARAGPELPRFLAEARVTFFSTVPTLLSMMEEEVPALRILILGGEPCPPDLVRRWRRPGRRMFNTYGPTETTVIATYAEFDPAVPAADPSGIVAERIPVTIGRPLPNYRVLILDGERNPVAAGTTGEICIGGPGLARGYAGMPELTAEKFISDRTSSALSSEEPAEDPPGERIYRTGDLGRFTADGEIEFMGRVDDQVKLRGFRIELSEIESALMQCPEVRSAAVTVREDVPGISQIVGYCVPRNGKPIDEDGVRRLLRRRLPAYMVPALIEIVGDFPLLPSGKVDKKRLPPPRPRAAGKSADELLLTATERKVAAVWGRLFAPATITRESEFFVDLGGHSLAAARMVSELRQDRDFRDLSVVDVYNHPKLCDLAAKFQTGRESLASARGTESAPIPKGRQMRCGAAQAGALYALLALMALPLVLTWLVYLRATGAGLGLWTAILICSGVIFAMYPAMLVFSIAFKWIVIGRYRQGAWPVWGSYYFRWWLVQHVQTLAHTHPLIGTPFLNLYYRLMGARIGPDVYFGSDHAGAFDLLAVGRGASIGAEASLLGHTVEDGMLKIGPISIGERCFVGARSALRPDTRMEDDARLADLSMLPDGACIPTGEEWIGSPARLLPHRDRTEAPGERRNCGTPLRILLGGLHAAGILILHAVYLAAALPGILLIASAAMTWGGMWFLLMAPAAGVSFAICLPMEIALLKWLLVGRVKAGDYPLNGWFYVRKRIVDQLMDMSLAVLGPLYATIYLPLWYRCLGVRLGPHAEVSTAHSVTPDLLTLEEGSFIADSVSLGAPRVDRGVVTLAPARVCKRAFVGNSGMLPGGEAVGERSLLGVLSAPPLSTPGAAQPETSWLGSPAVFLPRRQAGRSFSERSTYQPTWRKYLLRGTIEFFRITLPPTFFALLSSLLIFAVIVFSEAHSLIQTALVYPLIFACCGVAAALIVTLAKWALMGRYRPVERPLWSAFVWRTELVTAMHEHLADPFIVRMLLGTPFAAWFFRLLGARIGRGVYMETTSLTEFDLIDIGDGAALNQDCTIQTHLFEDRVMKVSRIHIGAGCSIGARGIVLYDSAMEDASSLGDLSLVMKGETIPAATRWAGVPARRVRKK
jgi:non-ribosomal peptide synthetase-like protein